jgi:peptide/nickel transport system permease protein
VTSLGPSTSVRDGSSISTAPGVTSGAVLIEGRGVTDTGGPPKPRRHRWWSALGSYLIMVYVLVTLNFLLPRLMPGDPITGLLAQSGGGVAAAQTRAVLARYYHLNGSLLSQYVHYLSRLAHGDLGRSIATNASVWHEMSYRIPWTLLLIGSSLLLATIVGSVAGIHAGWRRDRPADRTLVVGLTAAAQIPPYLLGSILLLLFAVKLGWFPLYGGQTPFAIYSSPFARVLDIGQHLLMPLLVIASGLVVWNYLVMRSGMVSELGSDYLMLGRAKGLRQRRLKYRYAARNAWLPVVSLTAINISTSVAANVVIERTFSYPGLGNLMFQSIGSRDYPVLQGVFLLYSVGIVTVNALVDVLYGRLDPRAVP